MSSYLGVEGVEGGLKVLGKLLKGLSELVMEVSAILSYQVSV